MSFREYCAAKTVTLCAAGIGGFYLILVSYLCGLSSALVLLLLSNVVLGLICYLFINWYRINKRLNMLKNRLDTLPEKYLIGETLQRPRNTVEQEYYFLMQEISRSAIGKVEEIRTEQQDYYDYVESWVHEMKTPLTACLLILSNGGDPAKLRRELRRADNLTETILIYAKLGTVEKDTQISHADLRNVCDQALREEMELLIAADISVTLDGECFVYTDARFMVFMIKQLLINSAKYCPGCRISITLAESSLTFSDNGPGIPAHELSRVTERGFTGTAGRIRGQSTGMGLYIVNQLCEILNIGLEITSEVQSFTRFVFSFPQESYKNVR